jgi:hypothetical protein
MPLPIAQNLPGMEWIPVIWLGIFIGIIWFVIRLLRRIHRANRRIGAWAIAICVLSAISIPAKLIWDSRTRTNTLQAVGASTGQAVSIYCDLDPAYGDLSEDGSYSFGPSRNPDGQLNYNLWRFSRNFPLPVIVKSDGYQSATVLISDRSPHDIIITLHHKATEK